MPDIDDLSNFSDGFSEGMPVNPLPASEVRRRGDRMRRRNTTLAAVGGVVAAAVFIGTPVALINGNDDDKSGPDPAPSVTQTDDGQQPTWLTEIPDEFPLADRFPEANGLDGSPTEVFDGSSFETIDLCGTPWPDLESVDSIGINYLGESEDRSSRSLLLVGDDTTASTVLADLRAAVQACPDQPSSGGDSVVKTMLVDGVDIAAEDSVVVAQQVQLDDGLLTDLTVTEVARAGNALYIETSYGAAAGDDVIDFETDRMRDKSTTVVAALCVFSADPCSTTDITPDPENTSDAPVETTTAAIPEDFPLGTGVVPSGDGEFVGPELDVEVFGQVEICGTPDWAPGGTAQRLGLLSTGIEYREARELATFVTTDDAVAAVDDIRDAVTQCPEDGSRLNDVLDGDTGYDSFTWGFSYQEGLGGGVFQLTRVGNAVLVLYVAGETSRESLQDTANDLTGVTQELGPRMCLWTEDGC